MNDSKVVSLFDWLDELTSVIQQQKDAPYLESLTISMEALFYGDVHEEINEGVKEKVRESLERMDVTSYSSEQIRKAVQLAVLKGMKKTTQHHHMMTPEAISLFIGY